MAVIRHCILLSSCYSEQRRICLHFAGSDDKPVFDAIDKIKKSRDGKGTMFSKHIIHTQSEEWRSVVEKDPYFRDVSVIDTVDEFVEKVEKDRYVKGLDVAKYILSMMSCTHTRLEKLTYMCYAEYLCETGKRLFVDDIYAYKYGPVIDSVYKSFSDESHSRPAMPVRLIYDETKKEEEIPCRSEIKLPIKSKIIFSEDGMKKISSIDRTLSRYGHLNANQLVELTHRKGSPWDVTDKTVSNSKIEDEIIIGHHKFETM